MPSSKRSRQSQRSRNRTRSGKAPRRGIDTSPAKEPQPIPPEGMRLNRYIARSGLCSRRKADELIAEQKVTVNGKPAEIGQTVHEGDRVNVGGREISPRPFVYILLNKPRDTISTVDDERDRDTVLDVIDLDDKEKAGLFPVGRLDRHTVGLLLLTNDGELAHRLMHPRYTVEKVYRVRTKAPVKAHELDALKNGIALDDGPAQADRVAYLDPQNHHEIAMMLHEGRNRQVRRMMEALGHEVVELERIHYAGLTTEGVRRGRWRHLQPREVQQLRRLVKLK